MEKFELYYKELEQLVSELESGNLSLAESLTKYQRGIELCALCKELLMKAKELIVVSSEQE